MLSLIGRVSPQWIDWGWVEGMDGHSVEVLRPYVPELMLLAQNCWVLLAYLALDKVSRHCPTACLLVLALAHETLAVWQAEVYLQYSEAAARGLASRYVEDALLESVGYVAPPGSPVAGVAIRTSMRHGE